jgi:anti-sigma factor RsiW
MTTERSMESRLRRVLIPLAPRKGYAAILKRKLLAHTRMPVELEKTTRSAEIATLTTLGLGAVATVAAVATIGGMIAGLAGSGALLLGAAKRGVPRSGVKAQTA